MSKDVFYINNNMTASLEYAITKMNTLEEFEAAYPPEFLKEDAQVGNYLGDLINKYKKKASIVSEEAGLATSYVGNIVNGKKRNPSRDALISICLAIGVDIDEAQYLLKYAGQAPLYVRRRRDVVIWFGFMKRMSLGEVNDNLDKRGFKLLVKDPVSSFALESLLWNVPDDYYLENGQYRKVYLFSKLISYLRGHYDDFDGYYEANGIKKLFPSDTDKRNMIAFIDQLALFFTYE